MYTLTAHVGAMEHPDIALLSPLFTPRVTNYPVGNITCNKTPSTQYTISIPSVYHQYTELVD